MCFTTVYKPYNVENETVVQKKNCTMLMKYFYFCKGQDRSQNLPSHQLLLCENALQLSQALFQSMYVQALRDSVSGSSEMPGVSL